jgi:hypothetical protein
MNTDNLSSNIKRYRSKMNRREQVLAQVSKWLNDFAFLEALLSDKEEYKLHKLAGASGKLSPIQYAKEARSIIGLKPEDPTSVQKPLQHV